MNKSAPRLTYYQPRVASSQSQATTRTNTTTTTSKGLPTSAKPFSRCHYHSSRCCYPGPCRRRCCNTENSSSINSSTNSITIRTTFFKAPTRSDQPRSFECDNKNHVSLPISLVLLFSLLLLISACKQSLCLNQEQQFHAINRVHRSLLTSLEPAPISIFSSLLGSDPANSAAQQHQQLQSAQSAADLHQSYKNGQTSDKVTLPGDILLGGLFPIHMKGKFLMREFSIYQSNWLSL